MQCRDYLTLCLQCRMNGDVRETSKCLSIRTFHFNTRPGLHAMNALAPRHSQTDKSPEASPAGLMGCCVHLWVCRCPGVGLCFHSRREITRQCDLWELFWGQPSAHGTKTRILRCVGLCRAVQFSFTSVQFICIARFHKLLICLRVLYNLYI